VERKSHSTRRWWLPRQAAGPRDATHHKPCGGTAKCAGSFDFHDPFRFTLAGVGGDTVELNYNVAHGNVFASLSELDDTLSLDSNTVSGFVSADGGDRHEPAQPVRQSIWRLCGKPILVVEARRRLRSHALIVRAKLTIMAAAPFSVGAQRTPIVCERWPRQSAKA